MDIKIDTEPYTDTSEIDQYVNLTCILDKGKLRVRIISPGYLNQSNCQFPKNLRQEGLNYKVNVNGIKLISTRGKYFYSISKNSIINNPNSPFSTGQDTNFSPNITIYQDNNDDCCICMSSEKNIVFNCGHLYTCLACSNKIKTCPICRIVITQRIFKNLFG